MLVSEIMKTEPMSIAPYPKSVVPTRSRGFTLTELMVTVTIAAILLAIGIPSFRSFILGQRVKTASFDTGYTLTLARSEAIKRNSDVVITPASGGWQNGWTVTNGDTTLSQQAAYPGVTITSSVTSLTYSNSGRLTGTVNPTFEISDINDASTRCITVNLSGLPTSKLGTC